LVTSAPPDASHSAVSRTVSAIVRVTRPAARAAEASTAHAPAYVRHSGSSVHWRTPCAVSVSGATQKISVSSGAGACRWHATTKSSIVSVPGAVTLNTPAGAERANSATSRTSMG
jgi:hypothetical protein